MNVEQRRQFDQVAKLVRGIALPEYGVSDFRMLSGVIIDCLVVEVHELAINYLHDCLVTNDRVKLYYSSQNKG